MELDLTGRTVLLTGATGGIGTEIARGYAAEGARVALGYSSDATAARSLADELTAAGGTAHPVRYRIGEASSPEQAVAEVCRRWQSVDVLVLNAMMPGGLRSADTSFENFSAEEWASFVAENTLQLLRTVQLVLPSMRAGGWGRIVLISSVVARLGKPKRELYGLVKSGFHGFMRSLMWDLQDSGVLINVVSPGLTLTPAVEAALPPALREGERSVTPTGVLSRPADVAAAVLFLGSGANANITGEELAVAGGR